MENLKLPRLCNGTRMIVEEVHHDLIRARIHTTTFINEIVIIPKIKLNLSQAEDIPLQRNQFAVQSCFALTTHKAQGQTMENILIYLERPVFHHGQLYGVHNRGKQKENIRMFLKDNQSTNNVVIKSILLNKL